MPHGLHAARSRAPAIARVFSLAFALALAVSLVPSRALACAACSCGDPTLTAMGIEKPFPHRVRLAVDERFGGHATGDGEREVQAWTLRSTVAGSWSPSERFTVALTLPVVAQWIDSGARPRQSFVGLGDAEASARAIVFRDRKFSPRHLVSLLAGLKTPTGPRLYDDAGYPFPEDDQPGSGSWDPFAGAAWGWFGEPVSFFSTVSVRVPTPGRRGYRRGQSLGASAGLQYQFPSLVAVGVTADLRWAASDVLSSGSDSRDSGGALIGLSPSVSVAPVERWLIRVSGQIQVGQWLRGHQSENHALILSTVVDLN
ncbi:MAG: hypothetical protein EXR72_10890 [Myxococcales bacterium]|nr:hypothetical protein [Myxococcales bacterium]